MPATLDKQFLWVITSGVGSLTPIGTWPDAGVPKFTATINGGFSGMSVKLLRAYGQMDEPDEPGTAGTLAHGNMVRVFAVDEFSPGGREIFSGTIEDYEYDWETQSVEVRVFPLARVLRQRLIPVESYVGQTAVDIADDLTTTYTPFTFDANNPTTGVAVLPQQDYFYISVEAALNTIRDLSGAGYIWYVTPERTLAFFQAPVDGHDSSNTAPQQTPMTHDLNLGYELVNVRPGKSSEDTIKKVYVLHDDGVGGTGVTNAVAGDYTTDDAREMVVTKMEYGLAAASNYATILLNSRNVIAKRTQAWVSAARYPVDTIKLGDMVRLQAPRIPAAVTSYAGYEEVLGRDLVVATIEYGHAVVRLELDQAQPNTASLLRQFGFSVLTGV